jgi:hypothetical protein
MSDTPNGSNGKKPDLYLAKTPLVTVEEAAHEEDRKGRREGGSMGDFVTKRVFHEQMKRIGPAIAEATRLTGQEVYDSLSQEFAQHAQQMEEEVLRRVLRELERRTLRGRIRALWHRVRPPAPATLRLVDPVEALDPGVHAAAATSEAPE